MENGQYTKEQLSTIRHDAGKVIEDVLKLSKQLKAAGLEHAEDVGGEVLRTLQDQVNQLEPHRKELWTKASKYGKTVDKAVKNQPYSFIGGALGLGYIVGRILSIGRNKSVAPQEPVHHEAHGPKPTKH